MHRVRRVAVRVVFDGEGQADIVVPAEGRDPPEEDLTKSIIYF